MSEYPRMIYKSKEDYKIVKNQQERDECFKNGYRGHWDTNISPIPEFTTTKPTKAKLELPIKDRYINILNGLGYTEATLEALSYQELVDIKGIGPAIAEQIHKHLHPED